MRAGKRVKDSAALGDWWSAGTWTCAGTWTWARDLGGVRAGVLLCWWSEKTRQGPAALPLAADRIMDFLLSV